DPFLEPAHERVRAGPGRRLPRQDHWHGLGGHMTSAKFFALVSGWLFIVMLGRFHWSLGSGVAPAPRAGDLFRWVPAVIMQPLVRDSVLGRNGAGWCRSRVGKWRNTTQY